MTRLYDLARQACDLHLDDAPPAVLERLRLQSLSVLGASAAGLLAPDVAPILRFAATRTGSLPVVPGVARLDLDTALRTAGSLSVALDYDDYLLCGHTGHTAHWASWLGGAALGASWDEVLRAQLVANELMGRLGGFCLAGRQNGQAWAFLHTFGGALVGGLLRGLSADRLAHALAIGLSRAPFVDWKLFGTGAKVLASGEATAAGWRAAELAEAGLEGPLDLLEDGSDFVEVFAGGRPLRGWLTGVGQAWLSETLSFKLVPGCAYLGSAVEAMTELLSEVREAEDRALTPADVLRIDVDGSLLTSAMEMLLGPSAGAGTDGDALNPVATNFSVARSLALLLARGGPLEPDDFALAALVEAARTAGDLPSRVFVHHDWRMTLATWDQLRDGIGIDRLLTGLGPSALFSAVNRARRSSGGGKRARDGVSASGPPGLGTGFAWTELPIALATERLEGFELPASGLRGLSDSLVQDPGDFLSRGIEKVVTRAGRWASRRVERWVRAPGLRRQRFDLGTFDLSGVGLPVPTRVKVLEKNGRVWEAEKQCPAGSPACPIEEVRAGVRTKFVRETLRGAPNQLRRVERLADRLVTSDGDVPKLPAGGPGEFLATWVSG